MVNECQRSGGEAFNNPAGGCRQSSLVWRAPVMVMTLLSNSKWPIELGKRFLLTREGERQTHYHTWVDKFDQAGGRVTHHMVTGAGRSKGVHAAAITEGHVNTWRETQHFKTFLGINTDLKSEVKNKMTVLLDWDKHFFIEEYFFLK